MLSFSDALSHIAAAPCIPSLTSVAFYPSAGLVSFGSEAMATKVPMQPGETDSFRFDLDDVCGEVLLLRWDEPPQDEAEAVEEADGSQGTGRPHILGGAEGLTGTEIFRYNDAENRPRVLACANFLEDGARRPLWERRLLLGGNPLMSRLPDSLHTDLVGRDLLDIPVVLQRIESYAATQSGRAYHYPLLSCVLATLVLTTRHPLNSHHITSPPPSHTFGERRVYLPSRQRLVDQLKFAQPSNRMEFCE